ncbi:helix-turn-helix domain-containing protein [uncultured Gilliamella sp.]|uniref:helix-turn-helix domain-containing protein n=1 Tax=uncultured Gilliamella sp. TaxID=1193505 RepID=UPI0025F69857|nr:helix-turn-helix domain-containing protein [uncultured Gilliamella sp.]
MGTLKTKKTLSQCDLILIHLQSGKTINPLQALNLYGCFRLGARIYDLKKAGFDIDSRLVHENGVQYAEYSMRAE